LNLQLGLSCDIGFNWYSLCEPIVVDLAEAGFLSPELLFRLNAIHVLLPGAGREQHLCGVAASSWPQ